jgi:hypothetical protein
LAVSAIAKPARAGIVGGEGEQRLVELRHRFLAVVLVDHPAHVLDAGVDVRLGFEVTTMLALMPDFRQPVVPPRSGADVLQEMELGESMMILLTQRADDQRPQRATQTLSAAD